MALTDLQARKAAPRDKDYKLADSGGLYLFVTQKGFKSWRLKYRFAGKEKRLVFGPYPEVSLAKAREERDRARAALREHRDPMVEERKRKLTAHAAAGATFERVATQWHDAQRARWSPVQAKKVIQAFKRDVFPAFGTMPLIDIDGPIILAMLREVEERGAIDSAKRIRQHVSAVFSYGMAESLVATDPAATIGRALKPIGKKGKQPALRSIEDARQLLFDMERSTSSPLTKLASRLLALTAVRPGVVRTAQWVEFEGIDWTDDASPSPEAVWRIPPDKMKLELSDKSEEGFEHVVPLASQAIEVLRSLQRLTGTIALLFPSIRSTRIPMSENAIGYMYFRNGYSGRHVPHGWRATFSTIMNERAVALNRPDDRAIIDAMLAHKPKGVSASEMAYNRALHMARRRQLATEWGDLLVQGLQPASQLLGGQCR
ncbi:tyrosine-type recombinase/integrase [Sphingomonas oligophenolica]|uniref:Integrase arm-type DNA-binding domain-containing protein n=1 Tax=Sphingomonas oligophenolica TaxID=301154 RepID=A0ABU9Y6M9_9SPHN